MHTIKTIEVTGTIDNENQITLDEPLPIVESTHIRMLIFISDDSEIDELDWLRSASVNPAFDFLKDPKEDIYTINDGRPFNDTK
ncbi:TPA: hypothetical protein ENS27_19830 [bacterium]|nr:hypothetical protein [bacterium]